MENSNEEKLSEREFSELVNKAEQGDAGAQFSLGLMYLFGEGVEQNYGKAFEWFEKSAEQGNAGAQNNLGVMYDRGEGVEQDYAKAFEWYEKAAEQGDADAQYNLGVMYKRGEGVEQDYAKAFEWYEKAAEQGHAGAQYSLGCCLWNGHGVEQNREKAFELWQKAAAQNEVHSQYLLGSIYGEGKIVRQDYKKSFEWYERAAMQGDAYAQNALGWIYAGGKGVELNYATAFEWHKKAAEQGDAYAQWRIGFMYDTGNGVKQDYAKAFEWYEKSAEQGDADAQYALGEMYYYGKACEQDYVKAFEWYEKSARQGNFDALYSLGVMYDNGDGVEQDYAKAFEWYEKAAEQGNAAAQYNLGVMYKNGDGVEQDYSKAFEWYKKAAEQGYAGAQNNLGVMYCEGEGAEQDYAKAFEWYEKAAEQGDSAAQKNLEECLKIVNSHRNISTNVSAKSVLKISGRKIGEIVRTSFRKLLESGLVPEDEIEKLQDLSYCSRIFGSFIPVLKPFNGCGEYRYYSPRTTLLTVYGKRYLLSNDWYDDNQRPMLDSLLAWMSKYAVVEEEKASCGKNKNGMEVDVQSNAQPVNNKRLDMFSSCECEKKCEQGKLVSDFESILQEFGQWLVSEAEPSLSIGSANNYKTYIRKIRDEFNNENTGVKFESLPNSYRNIEDSVTYADCSAFVAYKISSSVGVEQKYWSDRQSALHRFDDFLFEKYADDSEFEVWQQRRQIFSQTRIQQKFNHATKKKDNYKVSFSDSLDHDELMRKFLLRLKTQSRWYPNFGTKNGFLFPTRLLGRIFSNSKQNFWRNWLISGLENMKILLGDGGFCKFSDVERMDLLQNGECSVCLKKSKECKTLYTHTAAGEVTIACVNGDWRNVLTLNPRIEDDWGEAFYESNKSNLLTLSQDILKDLEKLNFDYELMERHENTRKGAGDERFLGVTNIGRGSDETIDRKENDIEFVRRCFVNLPDYGRGAGWGDFDKWRKKYESGEARCSHDGEKAVPSDSIAYSKIEKETFGERNSTLKNRVETTMEVQAKKTILETVVAKRKAAYLNGFCQFIKEDGSLLLAEEKGNLNEGLPWANEMVELCVYSKIDNKITEWSWKKIP